MSDLTLEAALTQLIAAAKRKLGEGEYKYYKLPVRWSTKDKRHWHNLCAREENEVTQEVWEANRAETKRLKFEAFMSRLKSSYTEYIRSAEVKGWRELLPGLLKQALQEEESDDSP